MVPVRMFINEKGLAKDYHIITLSHYHVKQSSLKHPRHIAFVIFLFQRFALELDKLARGAKDPGFTMVPVRMFINEKGLAKVVVALAKGKGISVYQFVIECSALIFYINRSLFHDFKR